MLQSEHDSRDGNDNPQEVASEPGESREPNHDPEVCSDGQKDKPVKQVINKDSDRPVIVCNYHKQYRCKFGLIGRECPYAHPKLCFRYKTNRLDPVKGCKKGNKCTYFHPPICYGSNRRRECLNLECKRPFEGDSPLPIH